MQVGSCRRSLSRGSRDRMQEDLRMRSPFLPGVVPATKFRYRNFATPYAATMWRKYKRPCSFRNVRNGDVELPTPTLPNYIVVMMLSSSLGPRRLGNKVLNCARALGTKNVDNCAGNPTDIENRAETEKSPMDGRSNIAVTRVVRER